MFYALITEPGALALELSNETQRVYRKQLMYVGDFVKWLRGQQPLPFSITPNSINHWHGMAVQFSQDGIEIPMPEGHTLDESAKRAVLIGTERGFDSQGRYSLFGLLKFIKPEYEHLALSNVSIFSPETWKPKGIDKTYSWPLQHVAFTDKPVIQGLEPFEAIALSQDDNLTLGWEDQERGPDGRFGSGSGGGSSKEKAAKSGGKNEDERGPLFDERVDKATLTDTDKKVIAEGTQQRPAKLKSGIRVKVDLKGVKPTPGGRKPYSHVADAFDDEGTHIGQVGRFPSGTWLELSNDDQLELSMTFPAPGAAAPPAAPAPAAAAPPAAPQVSVQQIAQALGIPPTTPPDQLLAAILAKVQQLMKPAAPPAVGAPGAPPAPRPAIAAGYCDMASKLRTTQIDALVSGGHITPATADELKKSHCDKEKLSLCLSEDGTSTDGFDGLVEALKKNKAIPLGTQSGLQLSEGTPLPRKKMSDNPLVKNAEKRAEEAKNQKG